MRRDPSARSTKFGAMRESGRTIDAAASIWVVKIDRGLCETESAKLEDWLAGDTRRMGALARAQAAWVHADRAQVYRNASRLRDSRSSRAWRAAIPWASAAAVFLALATVFSAWQGYSQTHLATKLGEIRRVPLADGSQITLDTQSRVSVRYEPSTRLVRLETGEALFEVAKDPGRPFVVQAGNTRVRAVGTVFMVRRHSDTDIEVTVTEGTVDVWRETSTPEPAIRLAAGKRTLMTPQEIATPQELTGAQLAGAVAWERGVIDLNGRTLADAAAEFNRYNRQVVVISDPRLAAQTVVGRFQATNPLAFVTAAAAMLDARVRTEGDRLILEPRPRTQK
jgi:transmembrane sensor